MKNERNEGINNHKIAQIKPCLFENRQGFIVIAYKFAETGAVVASFLL